MVLIFEIFRMSYLGEFPEVDAQWGDKDEVRCVKCDLVGSWRPKPAHQGVRTDSIAENGYHDCGDNSPD